MHLALPTRDRIAKKNGPMLKEAFVSYAHKDEAFILKVHGELQTHEVNAWLDQSGDIPEGAEWWAAIKKGIAEANAFVAFISFNSLNSEVCNWEVKYARSLNKRIIPVVIDERVLDKNCTDERDSILDKQWKLPEESETFFARENWDGLSKYQFIHLYPSLDATSHASAIDKVIDLIRNGIDHVNQHTRYLLRALEWENQKRLRSYRLSGKDLQNALRWLSEGAEKQPSPTPLHRQYIEFSRTVERNNLRILLTATAITGVMLAVLTVAAVLESIRANVNADVANFQRGEAISQRNEAQRVAQTFAIVDHSLRQPTGSTPNKPLLSGQYFWVSSQGDGTILRYMADSGQPVGDPLPVGKQPAAPWTDGKYIWVSNTGATTLSRIDPTLTADSAVSAVSAVETVEVGPKPTAAVVTGDWLWVMTEGNQMINRVQRDTLVKDLSIPIGSTYQAPIFDGQYVWVVSYAPQQLIRINASTGEVTSSDSPRDASMAVVADHALWLTEPATGILYRIDPNQPDQRKTYAIGAQVSAPLFDGTSLWIISAGTAEVVRVDPVTGNMTRIFVDDAASRVFREGSRLWVFTNSKGLLAFDSSTGQPVVDKDHALPLTGYYVMPVSDGTNLWFSNTYNDSIVVVKADDGHYVRTLSHCKGPTAPIFDGANMWFACQKEGSLLRVPALFTYYALNKLGTESRPRLPVYDGQNLWVVLQDKGKIVQLDAESGQVLQEISVGDLGDDPQPPVYDGTYIWVVSSGSGKVTRIETGDKPVVKEVIVGGKPMSITRIKNNMWVTGENLSGNDIALIDRDSMKIINQYDFGMGTLPPVYVDGDSIVWLSATVVANSELYQLDPDSGAIKGHITLGAAAGIPVITGDTVWATVTFGSMEPQDTQKLFNSEVPSKLYAFNRADGTLIKSFDLGRFANQPFLVGKYLWVTQASLGLFTKNTRSILAVDLTTREIVKSWALCQNPNQPFYDGKLLWFGCINFDNDNETGDVLTISPDTLSEVTHYTGLGRSAWTAAKFGESVWIVFQDTHNAAIFKTGSGELIRVIGLGKTPSRPIDDGHGYVWIANAGDSTIQRIQQATADQIAQ